MYRYKCLNPIAAIGLNKFNDNYKATENVEEADAILVRSAQMHEMELPKNLLAVARAGAGVNNIPLDRCAEQGIVVFNTPGANANGVKELVLAGMLLASRDVVGGIDWVKTVKDDPDVAKLVEKGKSKFAGKEIKGKKLGVIGLGAIGVLVANAAIGLGMEVYGCDPFISIDNAWTLSKEVIHVKTRDEIYANCDFITVHTPLVKNDDPDINTAKMINESAIRKMKDGGLTVIATYVFWIHHEENEGEFNFAGQRDISRFLKVCEEENMPVVLRIGPWDHGECVNGGFPFWLVDRFGEKQLRSLNADYMACVERFWTRLFREADGHLWKQGGCVVGCQIENECRGPWPYMQALKDKAVKIGFDVPFYTRTGWPAMNGRVKYGELLPLFGDYADGFWDRNLKEPSPKNYLRAFKFSNVRTSANIATEQLPQSMTDDKATAQYPYFTCELGGGMPSAYHRRVRVTPMDTYAVALVRLGSGSNLLGYYMYAGGTNPNRPKEGVFFNERQATKYTNHNDLPPFSYEFYGPISEFGETTEVY